MLQTTRWNSHHASTPGIFGVHHLLEAHRDSREVRQIRNVQNQAHHFMPHLLWQFAGQGVLKVQLWQTFQNIARFKDSTGESAVHKGQQRRGRSMALEAHVRRRGRKFFGTLPRKVDMLLRKDSSAPGASRRRCSPPEEPI